MSPTEFYQLLVSQSTLEVLKSNRLKITGQETNGIVTAYLSSIGEKFYSIDSTTHEGQPCRELQAYNVPMQLEVKNDITQVIIPALNGLTLPMFGGPSLMITGELSGCSFVFQERSNGALKVAHINPTTRVQNALFHAQTSGSNLQCHIQNQGRFVGSMEPVYVFGAKNYFHLLSDGDHCRCSVIGVRRQNKWDLYAQIYKVPMNPALVRAVKFY